MTPDQRDYAFDLRGYRIIHQAITADQLGAINRWVDQHPPGPTGTWIGDVEVHSYQGNDGVNYQNIIEGGPVFEDLIDHPSWIDDIRLLCRP